MATENRSMDMNDKPLFPRSSKDDEKEKADLRRQTKRELENEESEYRTIGEPFGGKVYCSNCGAENISPARVCTDCGTTSGLPSGVKFSIEKESYQSSAKYVSVVYGPPPMRLNKLKGLLMLGTVFIAILGIAGTVIYWLIKLFSTR